ncbi:keratin-like protein KRT222 [Platysternon megacephalum]|uniref:Keratin-like protein KRT222 n=1 Tax=Platysternon megacephalum TaxID=55544 RepID=A0A4D9EW21_9SAUR|nr:keratin-like protein KRT222 [Platysternon megacephalum]
MLKTRWGGESDTAAGSRLPQLLASTMRRTAACFPVVCLLLHLQAAGCFSGDHDHFLAIHQRKSGKPVFIYRHVQSVEKSLDTNSQKIYKHNFHSSSHAKISKLHPAIIVKSTFPRPAYDPSLNLLAMTGQEPEVENLPIPATNVIVVYIGILAQRMFQNEDSWLGLGYWTPARHSRCIWVVLLMNVPSICSYLVEVNGMQVAAGITEDEEENQKGLIWIYEEF